MSFAVIHMQKIKTGGIRGIQNHNQRLKESRTNPDINPEKSYLNKTLYEVDNDKTYYNRVKDRIKELNLPKAVRKDAVTMCGFVCTSDKEFFDELSQAEQDKFFKESYDFLKDRYGEKNIVDATVHYDEKTPHLHCYIVPVTEDGRLSAKDIFTRTELQRLQTDYHKHMNERGFELERGVSPEGKRKHLDTQEFKLQTKKQELYKDYNRLKNDFEAIRDTKSCIWDLEHIETKKSLLGGKITLSEKDYNNLLDMAKQGVYSRDKILDLKEENARLEKYNESYRDLHGKSDNEIANIKKENDMLKKSCRDMKRQGKAMFDTLEKHELIPEAREQLKSMREAEKVAKKVLEKSIDIGLQR